MVSKRGSSEAFGTKSFKLFLRILGSSKKRSKKKEIYIEIDEINELYYLHKLIEDKLVAEGGTYSVIRFINDEYTGIFNGPIQLTFHSEVERQTTYDILSRTLKEARLIPVSP